MAEQKGKHVGKYGHYVHNVITIGDFVIFNIAFLIAWLIVVPISQYPDKELVLLVNVAYLPVTMIFARLHKMRSLYIEKVVRYSALAVMLHAAFFVVLLFFLGLINIRLRFFAVFYPTAMLLLALWWITARKVMKHIRKKGRNFASVIIVGTGPTALHLYNEMRSDSGFGYRFCGFFSDDPAPETPMKEYIGRLEEIDEYVKKNDITEIYYTLSGERREVLRNIISIAENNVARFFYVPQINRYVNLGFYLHTLGSVPVLSLMEQPLESIVNRFIKRSFDICFSSVVLLLSPIIFIPVAIAIKVSSPGPVFFKQERTGYRGRSFLCWKFRTMKVNADADKMQAERNDPRKTRVGDFLRKTSIDELPQFINVFKGDMSVVGPRPHMLMHTEEYSRLIDQYMVRHYIKPGITGWAQVRGFRGQTEELWMMEKRVEHDVWYIKNWSFLLDIKIILKTVKNAIRGEENAF